MTHGGEYGTAVRKVRNWLTELDDFEYVGPVGIVAEYEDFQEWYYKRQLRAGFSDDDIQDYSTVELLKAMFEWNELGRPRGMTPNRGHKKSLTR